MAESESKPTAGRDRLEKLRAVNSSLSLIRSAYAAALGYGFQGDRNLYTALGYPTTLTFDDFLAKFLRQDIAKTIVRAPVEETWRSVPVIVEKGSENDETEFEEGLDRLFNDRKLRLWHYLFRVDLLCGIGRYAVLFMGMSDVQKTEDLSKPVQAGSNLQLKFLTPLTEKNARIQTWDKNPASERYGQPEIYNLTFSTGEGGTITANVHHTRVLHVVEDPLESDVYGTPRLEAVFNRLSDLDKVVGGSGEAFWQQGFPGLHFDIKEDADIDDEELDTLKDDIEDYIHRMTRVLRTQGIDVNTLQAQIADPSNIVSVMFDLLAGASGIPKRILIGSERGELASTQDEVKWAKKIEWRRENHTNPMILDVFITRMIDFKILPAVSKGWGYEWPDIHAPSDKEKADVAKVKAETIKTYADSPNAQEVVPPGPFLGDIMEMSEEEIARIEDARQELLAELEEEQRQIEEERRQAQELELEGDESGAVPPPNPDEEQEETE